MLYTNNASIFDTFEISWWRNSIVSKIILEDGLVEGNTVNLKGWIANLLCSNFSLQVKRSEAHNMKRTV